MRYDVVKVLFVGLEKQREPFFSRAQEIGVVHFIDKNPSPYHRLPEEVAQIVSAIKVVRGLTPMEQAEGVALQRVEELASKVMHYHDVIQRREEEKRMLKMEIARVGIFGHFSPSDVEYIQQNGERTLRFFCARHGTAEKYAEQPQLLHIGSEFGLDYFIAIEKEPEHFRGLVEMKIDKPLGVLKQELVRAERERVEAEQALRDYAQYYEFFHEALKLRLNDYELEKANGYAEKAEERRLFYVEGWVPQNKIEELHQIVKDHAVVAEEVAVEEDDTVPTYLENKGAGRIGEDLVHIYDTPASTDKDPSLWVLSFFALFFAIIVGDGGYGLLFLGVALYLRMKFRDVVGLGRRVINLVLILSTACVVWGFLSGSFFGLPLAEESPFRKFSLISWFAHQKADYHFTQQDKVYDYWIQRQQTGLLAESSPTLSSFTTKPVLDNFADNILLELALVIGVVHVSLSFMRYLRRNISGIGWIAFMIGGFLYFPTYLGTVTFLQYLFGVPAQQAGQAGYQLMIGGIGVAMALSLMQNKLFGILEITNLIQVFGDILSYLRLYALGLASSIVGATVNDMAAGMPAVFGGLVLLAGHSVNMLLAIAGGIIHGLRLNFLEWYHYSFEGGGKLFEPLRLLHPRKVQEEGD